MLATNFIIWVEAQKATWSNIFKCLMSFNDWKDGWFPMTKCSGASSTSLILTFKPFDGMLIRFSCVDSFDVYIWKQRILIIQKAQDLHMFFPRIFIWVFDGHNLDWNFIFIQKVFQMFPIGGYIFRHGLNKPHNMNSPQSVQFLKSLWFQFMIFQLLVQWWIM
jgi:hypothetical protein